MAGCPRREKRLRGAGPPCALPHGPGKALGHHLLRDHPHLNLWDLSRLLRTS